jgi:hypothetical protein
VRHQHQKDDKKYHWKKRVSVIEGANHDPEKSNKPQMVATTVDSPQAHAHGIERKKMQNHQPSLGARQIMKHHQEQIV